MLMAPDLDTRWQAQIELWCFVLALGCWLPSPPAPAIPEMCQGWWGNLIKATMFVTFRVWKQTTTFQGGDILINSPGYPEFDKTAWLMNISCQSFKNGPTQTEFQNLGRSMAIGMWYETLEIVESTAACFSLSKLWIYLPTYPTVPMRRTQTMRFSTSILSDGLLIPGH